VKRLGAAIDYVVCERIFCAAPTIESIVCRKQHPVNVTEVDAGQLAVRGDARAADG
jgi:hypothetical protein